MNLLEQTHTTLTAHLNRKYGKGAFHARVLLREMIKSGHREIETIDAVKASPKFLADLERNGDLPPLSPLPDIVDQVEEEGTIKFMTKLHDDHVIESVVIPMKHYNTLCVSTQVGCRMGCIFCRTATGGLKRNLATEEITAQLYAARFILKKKINNIVFMGMGEPFDNFDAVTCAIKVFNEPHGFDIALRHMTLSTCGLIPGIRQLQALNLPQLNLAVSIHSADDTLRSRLMPINRRYPLSALKSTLLDFPLATRRFILMEYTLFKGLNDQKQDAVMLAEYLEGLKVRINLIGYNPGPWEGVTEDLPDDEKEIDMLHENKKRGRSMLLKPVADEDIHRFAGYLESEGLFVVKRWSKGRDVMAGCGQLTANHEKIYD